MRKVQIEPYLEGSLDELMAYCPDEEEKLHSFKVRQGFTSQTQDKYHIPAADTGKEVVFEDKELFLRFAGLEHTTQGALLKAIRSAMAKEDVDELRVTFPWSQADCSVTITVVENAGDLEFRLNPNY